MNYLGIDVSKAKLDCSFLKNGERNPNKFPSISVDNDESGYRKLSDWLTVQQQDQPAKLHVILEATGIYHLAAAKFLHQAGAKVSVINPAYSKFFIKAEGLLIKTDLSDSRALAQFGAQKQPETWTPPSESAHQLAELLERLSALEKDLKREQNRQEKYALQQVHDIIKDSSIAIATVLQQQIELLRQAIDQHIRSESELKKTHELLLTIPGIGQKLGPLLTSLFHNKSFNHAAQVSAYAGLTPTQYESGSSVYRPSKLSKRGNPSLRASLYFPVMAAIRFNPHIKAVYQRLLERGKRPKSALCACMRKLLELAFAIVKNNTPYCADHTQSSQKCPGILHDMSAHNTEQPA